LVTNGLEKIGRISRVLTYNTQTANFTVGKKLTGATSGATATILEDSDSGASGTLTLGNIQGTFQNGEIITDDNSSPGSATTSSAVTWAYTTIANAPICKILKVIGSRLLAANLSTDETAVAYCKLDSGTNPPFTIWAVGTLADDPGQVNYRNAGAVNSIESFGPNIVVFSENGKWAFYINTIDSAGTLKKVDVFVISRLDFGGARGAISTAKGLFYANESGLWQFFSLGQDNVAFSDQEGRTSVLLGNDYFKDIDLSNASLAYDAERNLILLSCAKNSTANNYVIVYNTENKSLSEIKGWNINRFMVDNQILYGIGSTKTVVWQCFDGNDDDGSDIWTRYRQELPTGDLEMRQGLLGEYIQGLLSQNTSLTVAFDIYDVEGHFVADKLQFIWTAQSGNTLNSGWGSSSQGHSSWGGNASSGSNSGLIECFDGARGRIGNYQRIILDITGHDKLPHEINWFKVITKSKVPIRRRRMVQVT
jgi:hypothetical protein